MEDQIFDNKTRQELPNSFYQNGGKPSFWKSKPVIFSVIFAAIALIGVLIWFFLGKKSVPPNPTSNSVILTIKGPEKLTSGNEAEYRIIYRNGENADLVNISLQLFYPSGFKFKSANPSPITSSGSTFNLAVLKQGQSAEVLVRGKLAGSTGEYKEIKAQLSYKLSNFNSEFQVSQTAQTSILPPNLTMDINGPVDVVAGQDTTFTVTFTNVSPQDFENLAVELTYPEGFNFTSSNPIVSKNNNYWKINKLSTVSSTSIEITGSFVGTVSQEQLVKAELGAIINNVLAPQISSTSTFRLIPSSLSVTLTSDRKDIVNIADTVNYTLKYLNQGSIGLNNVVIVVKLEGPSLELTRISSRDSIVTGNILTWKAATLGNLTVLAPNEGGQINFSVPIKQSLSTNLKNQTIKASIIISSDEITKPTKGQDLILKLASQLDLDIDGSYVSGSVPMKVGKPTVFAITLILSNLSNDLTDTLVVASMPLPSQSWKDVVIPEAEKNRLSFDPNSGKITWRVGNLPAFTGKFTPASKVAFHLQVTPNEADKGKSMDLLQDIQATATDTFTSKALQAQKLNTVSTSSIDDDVLNSKGAYVQ